MRKLGFRAEPAVWMGALASIALTLQSALNGTMSWEDAVPFIVGVIIRELVSPVGSASSPNHKPSVGHGKSSHPSMRSELNEVWKRDNEE